MGLAGVRPEGLLEPGYPHHGFLVQHDPNATPNFIDAIKATNPKDFQVLAIRHDRDEMTDGIWAVANVKPHWHVIVQLTDQSRRIRVKQILAGLGIVYRQGLDDDLWKEHGVETIGNFAGYAGYLTHETAEAIRDAKERYDISEIVSNLTSEEIQQVREGFIRVSEKRKLTQEDLITLDREAYDCGYALKTLEDWFADQPFNVRSAAKLKVITEHYYHGVEARIREHVEVKRVCIYIQGAPNRGRTYAAEHALPQSELFPQAGLAGLSVCQMKLDRFPAQQVNQLLGMVEQRLHVGLRLWGKEDRHG